MKKNLIYLLIFLIFSKVSYASTSSELKYSDRIHPSIHNSISVLLNISKPPGIIGQASVIGGQQYAYSSTVGEGVWYVDNGQIIGPSDGYTVDIIWDNTATSGVVYFDSFDSGSFSKTVTITPGLSGGTITTAPFSVTSGSIPSTINATTASNGSCGTSYVYQWQKSNDNISFTDISGATNQNLSFTTGLTQSTYYRRMVTCSSVQAYTGSLLITVTSPLPLDPGSITSGDQTISYNTIPSSILATGASGGNCGTSYSYQWQSSLSGYYTDFTNVISATGQNLTISTPLTQTTYYRRMVTCGGATSYTSNAVITVIDMNSITTNTIRKAGVTDPASISTLSASDLNQNINYFDGLGRLVQKIQTKGSPNQKDMVVPNEYDVYGRVIKKYLPYVDVSTNGAYKVNALTANQGVSLFYKTLNQKIDTTTFPYVETTYESSPLNRSLEVGAQGKTWRIIKNSNGKSTFNGNTVKSDFGINGSSEVRIWNVTTNGANSSGFYGTGQLYKTISKDENWTSSDAQNRLIKEFKDKEGRVILKRQLYRTPSNTLDSLSTYYVYDDIGNLRYVIPPAVSATTFTEADQIFKDLIYAYKYDGRHRVIKKKIPGAGWTFLVYNKLNQVVLTQDSVQRAKSTKEWVFTKYDALGRIILKGIYQSNDILDTVQNRVNRYSSWEDKGTFQGYTTKAYPLTGMNVLVANYYDDYTFPSATATGFTYVADTLNTKADIVRGLLTGSKVKILGTKDSLLTVQYYDSYGRLIQSRSHNQVGGMDIVNIQYGFNDQVIVKKRVHTGRSGQSATILNWYEYDHIGRKKKVREKINSDQIVTLAQYNYNELGELIEKNLHSTNGTTFAQSIDYRYNNRGWLKSINKADLTSDGGITNDDSNDRFGLELKYESGPIPQFNGNISQANWKGGKLTSSLPQGQGYKYNYDGLNRLLRATSIVGPDYAEIIGGYDKMGNIQKLGRYSQGTRIDSLTYSYYNSANQLQKVEDLATTTGFNNGSTATNEYVYDPNGNLLTDLNSGITSNISYNYLNLPEQIVKTGTTLKYTYDATGLKLKRKLIGTIDSTEYVNGIQYSGGLIDFIQTEEGRAVKNGTTYLYRYNLNDHLGNLRVEVDASGNAIQEESYYPFGLSQVLPGNSDPSGKNKYQYNGKEFQSETNWYDYGARFYDPTLGKWHSIDPLTEITKNWSPYVYTNNNPVKFIDPNGMMTSSSGSEESREEYFARMKAEDRAVQAQMDQQFGLYRDNSYEDQSQLNDDEGKKKTQDKAKAAVATGIIISWQPTSVALPAWLESLLSAEISVTAASRIAPLLFLPGDTRIPTTTTIDKSSPQKPFYYITYTKIGPFGYVYVGRTSGYGDVETIVRARDRAENHHMNAKGYGKARVSTYMKATVAGGYSSRYVDPSYWYIRGSEQIQIQKYRELGVSGNDINGISPINKKLLQYLWEAIKYEL